MATTAGSTAAGQATFRAVRVLCQERPSAQPTGTSKARTKKLMMVHTAQIEAAPPYNSDSIARNEHTPYGYWVTAIGKQWPGAVQEARRSS